MLDINGDSRQQRGLEIAAMAKIERKGPAWLVPSQSGKGRYTVIPDPETPHCTCLDHSDGGFKCKHIFAAEYVLRREQNADGTTTVTETVTMQKTVQKVYPQNWRAYNAAQTHEKAKFQELLRDLCSGIAEQPQSKCGRPRLRMQDALFAAVFKVYSTVSGRRFMTDLREAQAKGYIQKTPHFNSIFNYLENPELTPILRELITQSSLPLKSVEVDFACDSSGFTTSRFHRWYDHKYGVRQEHEWVKVHLMCGVRTHIVTAVEIKDKDASDTKLLPALVDTTAENFKLNEVSADKGYGSLKNYKAIQYHGATPYIAFKSNHTGRGAGLWQRMFHYYQFNREQFLQHYHKRSNVESVFSMIKAKFRDHVRSKSDVAMVNEVLAKVLCHNICCLIQESHELGIDTVFWAESSPAQKQVLN
ncbi:MAG: transposase [Pseudolabrys sp.]